MYSFDVCVCVCACVCGQLNQFKTVKLRTSHLKCMFPGAVRTRTLKIFFEKLAWPGHMTHRFLGLNANSSQTVKTTDFKFDTHVCCIHGQSRYGPSKFFSKRGACENSLAEIWTLTSASCKCFSVGHLQNICKTFLEVVTTVFTTRRSAERGICYLRQFRPSVCLSVTRVDQSKTVEVKIMQFSPYSSPIPLVLHAKFHPEILTGSP